LNDFVGKKDFSSECGKGELLSAVEFANGGNANCCLNF